MYLLSNIEQEVFDPVTNVWSSWPQPSVRYYYNNCIVPWKDSLYLLGAGDSKKVVQKYNVSTGSWTLMESSSPFETYSSGCAVLPNGEIFVVGSFWPFSQRLSAIYNAERDEWRSVLHSTFRRDDTAAVVLGERIFAIGGSSSASSIEEYNVTADAWSVLNIRTIVPRKFHSVISVPAKLFDHLPGGCEGIH